MIDRICVKVQDHLNSLRNSETDAILEDVRAAENLIKDARNSKTVGSDRQLTVLQKEEAVDLGLTRVPCFLCPPSCSPTSTTWARPPGRR